MMDLLRQPNKPPYWISRLWGSRCSNSKENKAVGLDYNSCYMKEKEAFCISVTDIRGITKKIGPKNAEVNDLRENPALPSKT